MTVSTPTTSGQVLTSAYVNNNINSGLVWISTTTIGSTVTSVAVADCFSSTYDNYRILISGGIASTTADFQMILGSTVTGYVYASVYNTFTTATPSGLQATNDPAWRYIGGGTANVLQMETELQSPNLAKYTVLTSRMVSTVATGLNMTTNGYLPNTTQYTGMTVSPTAGTWTGGSITVYGYRKP
jgi:hypothetical protein